MILHQNTLPREYVAQLFYTYNGDVTYSSSRDIYNGSCGICREGGKQWLKKKRAFYLPNTGQIYCHKCGWSSQPLRWAMEVTGLSKDELLNESDDYDTITYIPSNDSTKIAEIPQLPDDCINLSDEIQLAFYKGNDILLRALRLIYDRRLYCAVNRPNTFYITLEDFSHKNRMIIPYYDVNGKISCYQSRQLLPMEDGDIKYKTKSGPRHLYGLNNISDDIPNIYVTEGPIDAMFIRNCTCTSGIHGGKGELFTAAQLDDLSKFPLHRIIWVLDSPYKDEAAKKKTIELVEMGESVFIWPPKEGKLYKDINDMAIAQSINEIPLQWINNNTCRGIQAKMKLKFLGF